MLMSLVEQRGKRMRVKIEVEVELEFQSGKFAPRDEVVDQLVEAIEGADPGEVSGIGADGDSSYGVVGWDVTEVTA